VDLSARLLRLTPPRPLVVGAPGGTAARLAVERAVRERGWQPAMSPAEANILVVAGLAGHTLEACVRQVWNLVPAPRARVDVVGREDVARLLDTALRVLGDVDQQRAEATRPPDADTGHVEAESHHDVTPDEHHGDHGHHGHDMGGMDMPGSVPMADRADDRDGLTLDQLHVPLGPVLPLWPAGLIVHTRLQGDVVQHVTVERLGAGGGSFWRPPGDDGPDVHRAVARWLDSSARLLALAGWTDQSVVAMRLRDEALTGAPAAALRRPLHRWAGRVRRSRTLRWLLAGIGSTPDDPTTPALLAGDALTRLRRWLDSTENALEQPPAPLAVPGMRETQWTMDALPELLAGVELAAARLVVASLDPDLDVLSRHEAHHG